MCMLVELGSTYAHILSTGGSAYVATWSRTPEASLLSYRQESQIDVASTIFHFERIPVLWVVHGSKSWSIEANFNFENHASRHWQPYL